MEAKKWWLDHPWRMVQTNLREIDMQDISAKEFAKELRDYNATVVTLNAAGILASYETKLPFHKKSEYLTGDSLEEIIDECHKLGIRVIARCDFSKVPLSIYEEHPDWVYRRTNGEALNYNGFVQTCVNGEYQQEKVQEILQELFEEHAFDGLFCNMSGAIVMDYDMNVYEPCHCDNCKRLFKEKFGEDIPDQIDMRNPAFGKYMAFINEASRKQKEKLYQTVKSINENIAVNGFDYMRTECNQDMENLPWIYDASARAKRATGPKRSVVIDNAATAFMDFRYRHSNISPVLLELRQWQNLVHSSSNSLFIMGTMDKCKDKSGMKASGKVFDFFAQNEGLYMGQKSKAEVLLVEKPLMGRKDEEADGMVRLLTETHISFDIVKIAALSSELIKGYKALVLADVRYLSDEQAKMLDEYVEAGGIIIATGETGCNDERRRPRQKMALASLGMRDILERKKCKSSIFEYTEDEKETFSNLSELEMNCIVPGEDVILGSKAEEAETFMHLIPEQTYGPPEICYPKETSDAPGVYRMSYGKGTGIYLPFMIGTFYSRYGYENTACFWKDVIQNLAQIHSIVPNLTPMCEIAVTQKENCTMIHFINTSGCFANSYFDPIEIRNIAINYEIAEGAKVYALNGGEVTIVQENDSSQLILNRLLTYEAIVIEQNN